MALKIGTFYAKTNKSETDKSGTYFEGVLETRKLHNLGNITIKPNEKTSGNEPDFLVQTDDLKLVMRGSK